MAAPLTWRNVDAPDFRGSLAGLQVFNDSIKTAFGGLNSGIEAFKADRADNADRAGLAAALKFQDPEAYKAALASGTLINPNMSLKGMGSLDARQTSLLGQATTEQALNTAREQDPLRTGVLSEQLASAVRGNRIGAATEPALIRQPFLANEATVAGIGLTGAQTRSADATTRRTDEETRFATATFDTRAGQLSANLTNTQDTNQRNRTTFDWTSQDRGTNQAGIALANRVLETSGTPEEQRIAIEQSSDSPAAKQAALAHLRTLGQAPYSPPAVVVNAPAGASVPTGAPRDVKAYLDSLREEAFKLTGPAQAARFAEISALAAKAAQGIPIGTQFGSGPSTYAGIAAPVPGVPVLASTPPAAAVTPNAAVPTPPGAPASEALANLGVRRMQDNNVGATPSDIVSGLSSNATLPEVVNTLVDGPNAPLKDANKDVVFRMIDKLMRDGNMNAATAAAEAMRQVRPEGGFFDNLDRAVWTVGGLFPNMFTSPNLGNGMRFDDDALGRAARSAANGGQANTIIRNNQTNGAATALANAQTVAAQSAAALKSAEQAVLNGTAPGRGVHIARLRAIAERDAEAAKALAAAVAADPTLRPTQRR